MSSDTSVPVNLYEEPLDESTAVDLSNRGLETVPKFEHSFIVVLYLQQNQLETLPDDFFPSLKCLMYLDLRDNRLKELPKTIENHLALSHLLLQNNCLQALPDELGTLCLKVLQVGGNPLVYPPEDVVSAGKVKILTFLHDRFLEAQLENEASSVDFDEIKDDQLDRDSIKIEFNDKDSIEALDLNVLLFPKLTGKCPKLSKSRYNFSKVAVGQSSKSLKPLKAVPSKLNQEKIDRNELKNAALKKKKESLARTEKILQSRRNIETLSNWRSSYRRGQLYADRSFRLDPRSFPYDTHPDHLTFLSREDIEKDLPDKYRKNLVRKARPTVPRKPKNDVHLAMKIKQLFENLESIDLTKGFMTPRTEQTALLSEIHKMSEIKQKLQELSLANMRS